ncbi:type II toxin-antitoxin system RelE/ParE family toxin [Mesorhizobium sp. ASY16-5R]|uniref:type II toxin-antitoxin system RelE/ParE family toxin n=1 Tax=Mesorhizobium sp. ASY16-5R TaxID=3445772 RepID=UPI003FA02FCD
MTDYRLSRRAEADLGKIFDYSLQHFGLNQAKRYRASLLTCLSTLADHLRLGRLARSVGGNVRRHEH